MKKYIPLLLFIMAFCGFLSTQILWDNFHSNAQINPQDKQKYSVYETAFQTLNLTTSKGTKFEFKSDKNPIVLLNFWASWCYPCLQEFPSLVKFQEKFKKSVKVIGINGDEESPLANISKVEAKYKLNFESVEDSNSLISEKFLINTYPVTIVFHQGKVIYVSKKIHDFMSEDFLKLIDETLIQEKK